MGYIKHISDLYVNIGLTEVQSNYVFKFGCIRIRIRIRIVLSNRGPPRGKVITVIHKQ